MKIGISCGDVNGIGSEILLKAFYQLVPDNSVQFVYYGSSKIILHWIDLLKIDAQIIGDSLIINKHNIKLIEVEADYVPEPGIVSNISGVVAAESLYRSVVDAINGKLDALVTLPISKEAIYSANWMYTGHTEMLADKCAVKSPMMILFKDNLRAALASIHIPINEVADKLSIESLLSSIIILNDSLIKDFNIPKPKIAVLGLNPHAGENGNIGNDEIVKITPAIIEARKIGITCYGPFPADGFFAHKDYQNYDAFLAMYHDQGLIPLKLLADGGGVNFTAGLPIVRTSPDHGTAFNISGKGIANPQSFIDSIEAAITIANNRLRR